MSVESVDGTPDAGTIVVRADGVVGGASVAGRYAFMLARDTLAGDRADGPGMPLTVALASLDGAGFAAGVLTLALPAGDALDLTPNAREDGAAFDAFAAAVVARAYAIPELTRALRTFAAHRGTPGSDHDRFFAPLIDALRRAREVPARGAEDVPWRAAERVDARRVGEDLRAAFAALAAGRSGASHAARRALEAELEEVAAPLFAALDVVHARAGAVAAAPGDLRLIAWRAWTAALGDAFRAADVAWEEAVPALADPRGGMGRLWRSLLRSRGVRTSDP